MTAPIIIFREQPDSQDFTGGVYTYRWWATGSTDPGDIYQAALLQLPPTTPVTQGVRWRDDANITITPENDAIDAITGLALWRVTCPYTYRPYRLPMDTQVIRVDTMGGREHITQSIKNLSNRLLPPNTGVAPDYKKAINVSRRGVDGVDITVPVLNFTVERCFNLAGRPFNWAGSGNIPWIEELYNATGTYNDALFSATDTFTKMQVMLPTGSALFLGCTAGGARSDGGLEVVFSFSASPPKAIYGGNFAGDDGKDRGAYGWDYIWRAFRDSTDANCVVKVPYAEFVEQVYKPSDFQKFRIAP